MDVLQLLFYSNKQSLVVWIINISSVVKHIVKTSSESVNAYPFVRIKNIINIKKVQLNNEEQKSC